MAANLEHLMHLGASIHQNDTAANTGSCCICYLANSPLPGGNILCFFYSEKEEEMLPNNSQSGWLQQKQEEEFGV